MMKENWVYCRGDIYCANLDPVVGSQQGGIRPVIVIQNLSLIHILIYRRKSFCFSVRYVSAYR